MVPLIDRRKRTAQPVDQRVDLVWRRQPRQQKLTQLVHSRTRARGKCGAGRAPRTWLGGISVTYGVQLAPAVSEAAAASIYGRRQPVEYSRVYAHSVRSAGRRAGRRGGRQHRDLACKVHHAEPVEMRGGKARAEGTRLEPRRLRAVDESEARGCQVEACLEARERTRGAKGRRRREKKREGRREMREREGTA